jgi:aerobic carbon-monoxide dehydrogenase small subunit
MGEQARAFELELIVNGQQHALTVAYNELLLDVLRERLGLTGAKRSCDVEICGACTVLIDGVPVSACTTLAWEARGRRVETVEGLAQAEGLHPIQQAFIDRFALQCGYCTPGMLMATRALLEEVPAPTAAEIRHYLSGNICRCTGYHAIVEAVQAAAAGARV